MRKVTPQSVSMAVLFVAASLLTFSPAMAAELEVNVSGVEKAKGNVTIRIYSGEDGWLDEDTTVETVKLSLAEWAEGEPITHTFDLPVGEYAVSVYHDEDDDGELDSNFIGIPKEPAGMSRKPKARMGPPKYEDAAFELTEDGVSMPVEVE